MHQPMEYRSFASTMEARAYTKENFTYSAFSRPASLWQYTDKPQHTAKVIAQNLKEVNKAGAVASKDRMTSVDFFICLVVEEESAASLPRYCEQGAVAPAYD